MLASSTCKRHVDGKCVPPVRATARHAPAMPVIEAKNLRKAYHLGDTEVAALRGVDVVIHEHEFVAVWGPSGSGKTTLCNILGLLDSPSEGQVILKGKPAENLDDAAKSELRNHSIGFVFQSFNLIPVLTALENVMLPLQLRGTPKSEARQKALALLNEVDLGSHTSHRPQKLSGGQQQRVAVARALVTDPAIIIADEPTANLDTENANRIIDLMRRINRSCGAAFIFSTHDSRLLDRVDRRIQLRDGEIIEDIRVDAPVV